MLRLRQQPPAGVVYAGSYFGGIVNTGTAVFDVHNPSGDLQKVSFGSLIDYFTCPAGDGACDSSDASNATSYEVRWKLIEKARHHIHIVAFSLMKDETGYRLRDVLLEKLRQGVAVRMT